MYSEMDTDEPSLLAPTHLAERADCECSNSALNSLAAASSASSIEKSAVIMPAPDVHWGFSCFLESFLRKRDTSEEYRESEEGMLHVL